MGLPRRLGSVLAALLSAAAAAAPPLDELVLPPGFTVSVFAQVPNARALAVSPAGVVYAGSMEAGKVYAMPDRDGDGRADAVHTIAEGLEMPTGVAWHAGALYVGAVNRILRFDGIDARLADPPAPSVVYDRLPKDRHHGWKYLGFGPDGKLYVPVGAPCNICDPAPPYASILRMEPDGSAVEAYARGIRNSVGFTWHPRTGALWFTDNGRDLLGDDTPACELNIAPRPGLHFGYPWLHGLSTVDPKFGARRPPGEYQPPVLELGAHVAPLGLRFYAGSMFPAEYRGRLFIAEHGSWNRSRKSGYRVMQVVFDAGGRVLRYEPFVSGWLRADDTAWGRPVDVAVLADGSMLVSDDKQGAVYRIAWSGGGP
ncbi:MAG: sorbosone dehydrogenase family protein [Gammaproteobacteria bacterium]